jgi:putative transposase
MQMTESFYLDNNTSKAFDRLNEWSLVSKNLYNQALYIIKNNYSINKDNPDYTTIRYSRLDIIMKNTTNLENTINYKLLPAATSQQILRLLDHNITSFFNSLKDYNLHPDKYLGKPEFPKFLRKSKYVLLFTNQQAVIKNNNVLQLSKHCHINIPYNININNFNYIRILPITRSKFKVEIIYTYKEKELLSNNNKYLSIDLGINNLATCISNIESLKPIIFNGRELKSYNHWYNKRKAYLQSKLLKGKYNSKKLEILEFNRYNKIQDIFHLYTSRIIQYCIKYNINSIIIGRNKNWKQNINIGKANNQKFVSIPHSKFINMLKYKCKKYGINYKETEESYTSKVDHLANESLKKQDSYLGKRIRRGLFLSSTGKVINADVNGSIGIMRKVVSKSSNNNIKEIVNSGLLYRPILYKCYSIKENINFDNLLVV